MFDRFVAIDWSGAQAHYGKALAVAVCGAGDAAPRLVEPFETRTQVMEWVLTAARLGDGRMLVGMDFAFSVPRAFYKDWVGEAEVRALWALVENICADAPDLYGAAFTRHPDYAAPFQRHDPTLRETDHRCIAQGYGRPESLFRLVGPKQVGKASLSGMRMLHRLAQSGLFQFWPFDAVSGGPTCTEIFPRLFLRQAGYTGKIRDTDALNHCLAHFNGKAFCASHPLTDHQTDALVAVAGMRDLVQQGWSFPLQTAVSRCEGVILGV